MKIINRTHYVTADLRAILRRVANEELEPAKRKRVVVTVVYTRRDGCSGHAWIGGNHCTVRIWKHTPRAAEFAKVAAHEFAHLRGMTHANMPIRYRWRSPTWRERYAWAVALGIRVQEQQRPARPSVDTKLAHARAGLARAETRLKRARTIERKWRAAVRYYERRAAALATVPPVQVAADSPASPKLMTLDKSVPS